MRWLKPRLDPFNAQPSEFRGGILDVARRMVPRGNKVPLPSHLSKAAHVLAFIPSTDNCLLGGQLYVVLIPNFELIALSKKQMID